MNKNVLIIGAIILAAIAGYFFRGAGKGDLVYDYADCIRDCESEHSTQLTSIRQAYDQCFDAALNDLRETLRNCPCGNPLKPPCIVCRDRAFEDFGEKIAPCRATRDTALAAENEKHKKCRTICNAMISFKEN